MNRRVVITGMGVVSSMGIGVDKFWKAVKEGKNGIRLISRFDTSDLPTKVAAEICDFDPTDYLEKREAKRMDRYTQFAMAATRMALDNSGLNLEKEDSFKVGVIIGSGIGGIETLEDQHKVCLEKGPGRVSPFFIPMMIANMAAGRIAIEYGIHGFNECVVTACATSNNAIGDAFKVIQRGSADVMIAGGAEASITQLSIAGFCSAKAMSANNDPDSACRPFDAERDGFVMGEGSGVLILEELNHAISRGAEIIAEIVGYGCTCDAFHITQPHPDGKGGIECMKLALKDAGISPQEVGYINAHGTATPLGDPIETLVVKSVFGDYVKKLAMSSTKSMTGHLLGAAGSVEAIITSLALKEGFLPPTINYNTPDPECDLDYVPNKGRKAEIKYALSNALGFGGHNAVLAFKKYESS
jgi:3-oxoacyl-[acyl-carrier-protein] synthase II